MEKMCIYFDHVQFRTMSSVVIPFSGERHMTVALMSLLPQYMQFSFAIQHHTKNISWWNFVLLSLLKSDDICHHSNRKTLPFCEKFILRWQIQFLRFCRNCLLKIGKQLSQFKKDVALQPIWPKLKLIWAQCCGRALLVRYWQRLTKWPTDGLACLTSPNCKLMIKRLWNQNLVVGKQWILDI